MSLQDVLSSVRERPYRNVFIAIIGALAVDAVAPRIANRTAISEMTVIIILAAALIEVVRARRRALLLPVIGASAIMARVVAIFRGDTAVLNSAVISLTELLFVILIWHLLHDVLSGKRSTGERVYGALCAYLFIGMLFALLFAHMEFRVPGSFHLAGEPISALPVGESATMPIFTYYSFVTLVTLGYGDIVPVTEHARSVAWLEALIGQLYLAVMVATLVGLKVSEAYEGSRRTSRSSADDGRDGDSG
jgi:hypothetical protein